MGKTRRPRRVSAVLILAAYPRRLAAERAAALLVRERLLACATVVPGARGFYMWRGMRHAESSTLLQGKTTRARAEEAVRRLRETHPDELPEILVFDLTGGDPDYLAWVAQEVKRS
jgi:periplasmic divalent cation tolerance protein